MVTQCVQDLIHLEDSWQRFNQQRSFDSSARQVKSVFGIAEDFTPPGSFLPGLSLRQIEIGTAAFCQQRFIVVEEIESKVEQAAGNRFFAPGHMFFRQVQATHTANQ